MNILNQLQEMFKEDMFSWRILIIHSGVPLEGGGGSRRICSPGESRSYIQVYPWRGGGVMEDLFTWRTLKEHLVAHLYVLGESLDFGGGNSILYNS